MDHSSWIMDHSSWISDSIPKARCSGRGPSGKEMLRGPMMGWIEGILPIRTMRKMGEPVTDLIRMRDGPLIQRNPFPFQKQSKFHSFYWLIDIMRHGKDEFVTQEGDLISLDLDRSKYNRVLPLVSPNVNFTWCFACKMDRWVFQTLSAVSQHPQVPKEGMLSNLVKTSLSFETHFPDVYTPMIGEFLDKRVEALLDCVSHCIRVYGESDVLMAATRPEPKPLIRFYVMESEYKDRNGMKAPENINELLLF